VFALLAIGLVLTARASNVVNFAHAAVGMFVAYAYHHLRASGELALPVIGLPDRITVVERPTVLTALVAALTLAAAIGLVLHVLVFRLLRGAPPLARVVASLGVFLYLQEVARLRFRAAGAASFQIGSFLPRGSVDVLGRAVPVNRFVLAAVAIAIALVLAAVFRWTRYGLATRAAAEHERAAVLLGLAPDRLAAASWVLASVLSGLSVILVSGITKQLDPVTTSLLVVPALAAALVAGLSSFLVATAAGLAIGMVQSATLLAVTRADWLPDWLPRSGIEQSLPFLVILAAITWRGRALPGRDALVERRLARSPTPRRPAVAALAVGGAALVGLWTLDTQWRLAIVVSTIASVIALSSVVLTGYVGQISLAQYAFAGVAAFTTAKLAGDGAIAFPWAPLLAIAVTVAVGVLAGLPAVRVRGMTLAVATAGAAVAIEELFFASEAIGGLAGRTVPPPRLLGVDLGFFALGRDNFRPQFGTFAVVLAAAAAVAVANLRRSSTGLRWLAVRANERAAAAAGVNVTGAKLSAFAVSSFLAAIGGVLLAYQSSPLSPSAFTVVGALALLALTYLGGIASVGGAMIAGVLASGGVLTRLGGGTSGSTPEHQFAISGLVLVAVAVAWPDGVAGALGRGRHRFRRARRAVPAATGTLVPEGAP
jgi:ABC-type branched-subunit amino acid transport system permease subunit